MKVPLSEKLRHARVKLAHYFVVAAKEQDLIIGDLYHIQTE